MRLAVLAGLLFGVAGEVADGLGGFEADDDLIRIPLAARARPGADLLLPLLLADFRALDGLSAGHRRRQVGRDDAHGLDIGGAMVGT